MNRLVLGAWPGLSIRPGLPSCQPPVSPLSGGQLHVVPLLRGTIGGSFVLSGLGGLVADMPWRLPMPDSLKSDPLFILLPTRVSLLTPLLRAARTRSWWLCGLSSGNGLSVCQCRVFQPILPGGLLPNPPGISVLGDLSAPGVLPSGSIWLPPRTAQTLQAHPQVLVCAMSPDICMNRLPAVWFGLFVFPKYIQAVGETIIEEIT